jgi:hypothetical protein
LQHTKQADRLGASVQTTSGAAQQRGLGCHMATSIARSAVEHWCCILACTSSVTDAFTHAHVTACHTAPDIPPPTKRKHTSLRCMHAPVSPVNGVFGGGQALRPRPRLAGGGLGDGSKVSERDWEVVGRVVNGVGQARGGSSRRGLGGGLWDRLCC